MKYKGLQSKYYLKPMVASTVVLGLMTGLAWAGGSSAEQTSQTSAQAAQSSMGTHSSMHKSEVYSKTADEIIGMEVLQSQDQKKIGEVENIVKDKNDGSVKAVIAVDQVLGLIGGKKVVMSLDELDMQDGKLMVDSSEERLKQRPEYSEADYMSVDQTERTISEFAAMGSSSQQEGPSSTQGSSEPSSSGQSPYLGGNTLKEDADEQAGSSSTQRGNYPSSGEQSPYLGGNTLKEDADEQAGSSSAQSSKPSSGAKSPYLGGNTLKEDADDQ